MIVIIKDAAQRDIERAADWFEAKREGFGQKFTSRVLEAIEKIELNPQGFTAVYKDARRVQLRQFPEWALWFQIKPDHSVAIACLSGKRHPVLAKERSSAVIEMKPKDPTPS